MTGARSGGAVGGVSPLDVLLAVAITAVIELSALSHAVFGDPIRGPRAVVAGLPLLMAVPLVWRRRRPLLAWCLGAAGIVVQALSSGHSAEGLVTLAVLFVGCYSVAAYSDRRDALLGLAVLVVTYGAFAWEDPNTRSGRASEEWATALFAVMSLACWLAGLVTHDRQAAAANAARAAALEQERTALLADERSRIARELHDIVSHNLSVVVLQASGARARAETEGADVSEPLEKIESSGRTALVEMRRMLGVLRADDGGQALAPQPGLGDIVSLVDGVRRSGLPVTLDMSDDLGDVPPAVGLSAYRIVQESLTNTMRHSDATNAEVVVRRDTAALVIEVHDMSTRSPVSVTPGHGLTGMRERVGLLGGDFLAGWDAHGFLVRARLPVAGSTS